MRAPIEILAQHQKITENLENFKHNFKQHFLHSLNISYEESTGLLAPRQGDKTKLTSEGMEIGGTVASAIPVVGSLIALPFKAAEKSAQYAGDMHQKNRAENVSKIKISSHFSEPHIKSTIDQVVRELMRIYEFQITLLHEDDVHKIAIAAANMILSYLKDAENPVQDFNRNTMLRIIVQKLGHTESESIRTQNENITWEIPKIFTKPGIQKRYDNTTTFHKSEKSNHDLYGYRGEIMFYDAPNGCYHSFEELDEDNIELIGSTTSYPTFFFLCNSEELTHYKEYLKANAVNHEKQPPKSFNIFLQEKYQLPRPIIAVYRDKLNNQILNDADFSNTDFSGLTIKNVTAKNTNFNGCIFTKTKIIQTNFEGSTFNEAKLNCSELKGEKTSFKSAEMNNADFSFAHADLTIDFSDITEKTGMITEGFNFSEIKRNKVNSTECKGKTTPNIRNEYKPSVNNTGQKIAIFTHGVVNSLSPQALSTIVNDKKISPESIASAEKTFKMLHDDRPKEGVVAHSYNQIGTHITFGEPMANHGLFAENTAIHHQQLQAKNPYEEESAQANIAETKTQGNQPKS